MGKGLGRRGVLGRGLVGVGEGREADAEGHPYPREARFGYAFHETPIGYRIEERKKQQTLTGCGFISIPDRAVFVKS